MPEYDSNIYSFLNNSCIISIIVIWIILNIVANWKLFKKAGKPGFAAIIPIYNLFVEMDILNGKAYTALLYLIPPIAVVYRIINIIRMSICYNRGLGLGIFGIFFNPIMRLILAFSDDAKYIGPKTLSQTFSKVDKEI